MEWQIFKSYPDKTHFVCVYMRALVLKIVAGMDFALPSKKGQWLFRFPVWALEKLANLGQTFLRGQVRCLTWKSQLFLFAS